MKSAIASAVLGAAALVNAASIPHGHGHTHTRRATAVQKRDPAKFLSPADVTRLASVLGAGYGSTALTPQTVQLGKNIPADDEAAPVTVGGKGPFLVEFKNESPDDIILVTWSNIGKTNPWDAAFVTKVDSVPDVTHTLRANTSTTVSYDPNQVELKSISGGFAAIYPNTQLNNGMIYDTWGELTFKTTDEFSTTDVSRLINYNGNKMEIHNYNKQGDDEPACSSTMEKCSFVCEDGAVSCQYGGIIQNCPVGTPGTTASADKKDGGCGGLRQDGGFVSVSFF